MTPTQLRAYSAVVRQGSVKSAAAELEVSGSAVSLHIAQLRKELGDQLFHRTAAGLAFTPAACGWPAAWVARLVRPDTPSWRGPGRPGRGQRREMNQATTAPTTTTPAATGMRRL